MNVSQTLLKWAIFAIALALSGCANNGNHVKNVIGDASKLADIHYRHDTFVNRDASAETPIGIFRVEQFALTDPTTGKSILIPTGGGQTTEVVRLWRHLDPETLAMRTLPGVLTAITGGVVQGEYQKSAIREAGRSACPNGKCPNNGPTFNVNSVSSSGSKAVVDGISLGVNIVGAGTTCGKDCLPAD